MTVSGLIANLLKGQRADSCPRFLRADRLGEYDNDNAMAKSFLSSIEGELIGRDDLNSHA